MSRGWVIYWLIAVLTFGYAFNNEDYGEVTQKEPKVEQFGMAGISSLFWPLYWSTKAFK